MFFYTFLPRLLNMSLTAGVAVLFVLLLRLLLRRAPKAVSYVLWAVVLFRLLCPVAPASALSLYNLFDAPAAQTGGLASSMAYVPVDIVHTEYPEVALPFPGISEPINEALPQGEEQLRADPLEAPMAIATWVWMAGVGAMALYSTVRYVRLRRCLLASMLLRDNIYLADGIASPFVLGLLRPKIYLPSSLAERERDYIILHEQHHIRRLDHIVKALAFLALCIHWFNPLVWLAFVLSARDMEMSCDEAVIKKLGAGVRADYSASLLSLATGKRIIAGVPLAFGEGDAKGRIKNLANWKKPAFWVVLVAVLACIALAVGLLTNPATKENGANGTGYYLRIGAQGVMEIELSMPNSSGGVIHADGSPFKMGEEVRLEMLDAVRDIRGVSIAAMDADGEILYALSVPEGATDAEIVNIVGGDGWLLAPAGGLGADPLHYKSAAAAATAVEEMTAIYCPDVENGADGRIQIGAASGAELAQYLQQWDWKPCAAPRHALPSPGSVEFIIAEDYRVSVHQRKEGSLRRYGAVEYRGETRYYSIGRNDYPDAVALVYARNEAAAAPAVQEWFNYLNSPADMPWEGSLEIEIPAFPDLTFRYYPEWIEAGNKSAVRTILTGMPIWNAYFADLSGDGLPEICATATFGSGVIDSRLLVYDYVAGESYVLEDRGEYDYALTLHDGRLLAVQSVYMGESIATGELRLVQRADGTKELRAELRPMEGAATVSPDIVRGVDLDHDGSMESIGLEQLRYGGELYKLHVRREDGSLLWSEELGIPHAGWNTLLLYESGGRDYLIRYKPTMYQGEGTYSCTQFHLANGRENVVHTWEADFSLPVDMSESMERFENEVNAILENSILLATTEQLELVVGPVAATEVPQIYPVRFDPDEIAAAMNEAEEGPYSISPEAAAARHIEMKRLFENAAPWRKGSRRVGGDWDGDGIEDSVGFGSRSHSEFTVELSGSGTLSIRTRDTAWARTDAISEDAPWGADYYFDMGDLNADGIQELVFSLDTGAQGGDGAYCLLVCPTDGRGIEAFTQIETGQSYRIYWEKETDTLRLECKETGYVEHITERALIEPYLDTGKVKAQRIEWLESLSEDVPAGYADGVSGFVITDDGHIITSQYVTAPGGSHSEKFGNMLTEYAYGQDGQLQVLRAWFVHNSQE